MTGMPFIQFFQTTKSGLLMPNGHQMQRVMDTLRNLSPCGDCFSILSQFANIQTILGGRQTSTMQCPPRHRMVYRAPPGAFITVFSLDSLPHPFISELTHSRVPLAFACVPSGFRPQVKSVVSYASDLVPTMARYTIADDCHIAGIQDLSQLHPNPTLRST